MKLFKLNSSSFLKQITFVVLVALGAINIMGCSNDNNNIVDVPSTKGAAVLFNAAVEKEIQSRGASMDLSVLKKESFGIMAYYTGKNDWNDNGYTPNFMYNQKVTHSGSGWTYSPIKYWPTTQGDKVSFFAYAPFDDSTTDKGIELSGNNASGAPFINFTLKDTPGAMVDLVTSNVMNKQSSATPATVDFSFQHALSRIAFSAKTAENYVGTKVRVKSVSIKGDFFQNGQFDLSGEGSWTNTTNAQQKTYTPALIDSDNELEFATEKQINKDNQYLMVIPQNEEKTFNVEVVYTVDGVEAEPIEGTVDMNFEQGKAYNIVLNISLDQNLEIFTYTVPWDLVKTELILERTFVINPHPVRGSEPFEVMNKGDSKTFTFKLTNPVDATWKAYLSNPAFFELSVSPDENSEVFDGAMGSEYTITVKAKEEPVVGEKRSTELYIIVNTGVTTAEIPLFKESILVGEGNRIVIEQPVKPAD